MKTPSDQLAESLIQLEYVLNKQKDRHLNSGVQEGWLQVLEFLKSTNRGTLNMRLIVPIENEMKRRGYKIK
jgi:hypothetical protein